MRLGEEVAEGGPAGLDQHREPTRRDDPPAKKEKRRAVDGEERGRGPVYPGGGRVLYPSGYLGYPHSGPYSLPGTLSRCTSCRPQHCTSRCSRWWCTVYSACVSLLHFWRSPGQRLGSLFRFREKREEGHNEAMRPSPSLVLSCFMRKVVKTVKTVNISLPNKHPPFNTRDEQKRPPGLKTVVIPGSRNLQKSQKKT